MAILTDPNFLHRSEAAAVDLIRLSSAYAPTPLLDLSALAAQLGVSQVLAKDEGRRMLCHLACNSAPIDSQTKRGASATSACAECPQGTTRVELALRPLRHTLGTPWSYLARPKGFEPLTSAVGALRLILAKSHRCCVPPIGL